MSAYDVPNQKGLRGISMITIKEDGNIDIDNITTLKRSTRGKLLISRIGGKVIQERGQSLIGNPVDKNVIDA